MPKFQLLTGYVNLAGDRGNVVFRGTDDPMTYPEALVLQALHGGSEHVHTLVEIGEVERSFEEEHARLAARYGVQVIAQIFPATGGRVLLPLSDSAIPTFEDVKAAQAAAEEVMARRRSAGKKADKGKKADAEAETGSPETKPAAPTPTVPDLTGSK